MKYLRELNMKRYGYAVGIAVIAFWNFAADGKNLIFNSGFELDDSGYECVKTLQPSINPKLTYTGIEIDKSNKVSGAQSIKINNPYGERTEIICKEVELKAGKKYTFSIFMKSSVPKDKVQILIESIHVITGGPQHNKSLLDGASKTFEINDKWQRYSFAFVAKTPWQNKFYSIFITLPNGTKSIVWLDDIEFSEESAKPYSPGSSIEAAVATSRKYYIYADAAQANPECKVLIANYADQVTTGKVIVTVTPMLNAGTFDSGDDNNQGTPVFQKTYDVSVAPHEVKSIPCILPLGRYGAYLVKLSGQGKLAQDFNSLELPLVIAGKYEPSPIKVDDVCVSINMPAGGFDLGGWRKLDAPGFYACGGGPETLFTLLAQMGCRLIRDWNDVRLPSSWNLVEPSPGKFDFSWVDLSLKESSALNIETMLVVGGWGFRLDRKAQAPPEWVRKQSRSKLACGEWKLDIMLPPLPLWRKYIRALGQHCKGKVQCYEIFNEPNGWIDEDNYLEYLKVAYEELKTIDENNRIVGFCSTSDHGGDVSGFLKKCFLKGGHAYTDIVSFHPYDSSNFRARCPADKMIEDMKKLVPAGTNKQISFWNTELFFLKGFAGNYIDAKKHGPHDTAQRFLTDIGEGVGQSICLAHYMIFRNRLNPHYYSYQHLSSQFPNADFVVYNTLARFFEGAKPLAKFKRYNTVCYVFSRKNTLIAAIWNYGKDRVGLSVNFHGRCIDMIDMYGNKIICHPENIPLTGNPVYFEMKKNPEDEIAFINIFKDAKINGENPVSVYSSRMIKNDNQWIACIGIQSLSSEKQAGSFSLEGGAAPVRFTLPAQGEQVIMLSEICSGAIPATANATIRLKDKTLHHKLKLVKPETVTVRQNTDSAIELHNGKAVIKFHYDAEYLCLDCRVKDETPSGKPNGRLPWAQDCIELFFDTKPEQLSGGNPSQYNSNIYRVFIAPYETEDKQITMTNGFAGVKGKITLEKDGFIANIRIPLSSLSLELPLKGKCLGFDMVNDDADTIKRMAAYGWNAPNTAHMDRLSFGILYFK